jgi:hypothetical protein
MIGGASGVVKRNHSFYSEPVANSKHPTYVAKSGDELHFKQWNAYAILKHAG